MIPPRIAPPQRPLGRLAFLSAFVRNPLEVVPQAAYEQDFVAFRWARANRYWITGPALIKAVLLDQREIFRKISQIRLLSPLLGKGILTSEGDEWKWQRQAAAPMFRAQELERFVPQFVAAAQRTLERWRAAPTAPLQAVDADMTRATFELICATILPAADEAASSAIRESIAALQEGGGWDQLYAAIDAPTWMPRPGMRARWRAVSKLRATVSQMLLDRTFGRAGRDDLSLRLATARDPDTGQSMDDGQLVDNLLTFYLAGHETTARALTWTLFLLALYPEWSERLREEIGAVTGGAPVQAHHIGRLERVRQVLQESMRLYPPVPLMTRQAVAATELGGHAIAAGSSVLIPIWAVHRHAARWPNPDVFDPDRFSPANEGAIARYHYMPFGAGPRICIGRAFAELEATAILATLLQHATFSWPKPQKPHPVARVTLVPSEPIALGVKLL